MDSCPICDDQHRKIRKRIKKAMKLIRKYKHWTDGAFATNKHGFPCTVDSAKAQKWCALGAIKYVGRDTTEIDAMQDVLDKHALTLFGHRHVLDLNEDDQIKRRARHRKIIKVFKAAIEDLK